MTYNPRGGPFVPSLGNFDTLAELSSTHPATTYLPGMSAYTADTGLVFGDGVAWKTAGPAGNSVGAMVAGDATAAAANTTLLNAALAGANRVTFTMPGTFYLACSTPGSTVDGNTYNVALLIPSNTHLILGPNTTLKCAAGVTNPVLIKNSDTVNGNVNITLEGGIYDHNYSNNTLSHTTLNSGTGSWCGIMIWMQKVTGLRASNFTMQNAFAGFLINNVTYGTFENVFCNDTGTNFGNNQGSYLWPFGGNTGIHIRNIFGQCNDDMIGLISDFGADARFTNLGGGPGPVKDIIIDGVRGDTTNGTLNFVRVGPSTTTNPISNVQISNVSGTYAGTAIKIGSFSYSTTGQINDVQISNICVSPSASGNTGTATIDIENATAGTISSLSITNFNASIPAGTTAKPFLKVASGTVNRLFMSNCSFFDKNTSGSSLADIDLASTCNSAQISNVESQSGVTTGDGFVVRVGSTTIDSLNISNVYMVRRKSILTMAGSGGFSRGVNVSNVHAFNPQSQLFNLAATGAIPCLTIRGVTVNGTSGGANGFININGITGTTLIQMQAVVTAQGASANIVRAASETIRVQTIDTPVPSTILTPTRGDVILDSTSNNDPFRWTGAAWTGL